MKRYFMYLVILLNTWCLPVYAADNTRVQSYRRALEIMDEETYHYAADKTALYDSIPFTRAGGLIILQATVDNVKGNFILDTGAPGLILNAIYFTHLTPRSTTSAHEYNGITGMAHFEEETEIALLSIGDFHFFNVQADKVNLAHIENSRNITVHGLLGYQLFRRFDLLFDFDKQVLYLYRAPQGGPASGIKAWSKSSEWYIVPIQVTGTKILAQAIIGKRKLNFVVDTGAETNILDSRLPKAILAQVARIAKVSIVGSGKQNADAWYGQISGLQLGNQSLCQLEVILISLEHLSLAYGRSIDGMLGNTLLANGKMGISFIHHVMYLSK